MSLMGVVVEALNSKSFSGVAGISGFPGLRPLANLSFLGDWDLEALRFFLSLSLSRCWRSRGVRSPRNASFCFLLGDLDLLRRGDLEIRRRLLLGDLAIGPGESCLELEKAGHLPQSHERSPAD